MRRSFVQSVIDAETTPTLLLLQKSHFWYFWCCRLREYWGRVRYSTRHRCRNSSLFLTGTNYRIFYLLI